MELDNNNHSVFLLYYHLVLVAKYRRKVFSNKMSQYAKDIFVRIGSSYNITLEEWNHEQDHVHILFRAHPNTEISKFINAYKSASSRLIKKDFPEVRQKLMLLPMKKMLTILNSCRKPRKNLPRHKESFLNVRKTAKIVRNSEKELRYCMSISPTNDGISCTKNKVSRGSLRRYRH